MELCKRLRITRHDNDLYLERFILFRCRWFGVYLHRFVGSDDECLHCHPWPFISIILRGGYFEHVGHGWREEWGSGRYGWAEVKRRWHGPLSMLFRRAEHAHRIELAGDGRPTWSLVLIGPRRRSWVFFTRLGWLRWTVYRYVEHCS